MRRWNWRTVLRHEITKDGETIKSFAAGFGMNYSYLVDMLKGNHRMSLKMALKLEVTSYNAEFWLTKQMEEDLKKARKRYGKK